MARFSQGQLKCEKCCNQARNCPWESIHNLPKDTQDREPRQSSQKLSLGVNPQSSQGHAGAGTTAIQSGIVLGSQSTIPQGHAGSGTTAIKSGIVLGSQSTIFPRTSRSWNHSNPVRNCPWESIHNPPKDTREPEPQQSSQKLSLGVNPQSSQEHAGSGTTAIKLRLHPHPKKKAAKKNGVSVGTCETSPCFPSKNYIK